MKKDNTVLTKLQEQINTDITVRFLDLSHQNIGKLSLLELRECCSLLSQLGCLYSIDLSDNSLCELNSLQSHILLKTLKTADHLERINFSNNHLENVNKYLLHRYASLLSERKNATSTKDDKTDASTGLTHLNLSNTDLSISILECRNTYFLQQRRLPKYTPLRTEIFAHALTASNLCDLDISNTQLHQVAATVAAWQTLCGGLSTLKNLRHINLSANNLNTVPTDQRQLLWSSLSSSANLEYFALEDNGFDEEEIFAIAPHFSKHLFFIGIVLNQGLMDFTENAQALFNLYETLRLLLNSGETAQAKMIVNEIILLRGLDSEIKDIKGYLGQLNNKIAITTTDLLNPINLGLFSTREQRNRYENFYNQYRLKKQQPRNFLPR